MTRRAIAVTSPAAPAEPAASVELEMLAKLAGTLRRDWRGDIWLYYQTRSDLIARLRWASRRVAAMERVSAEAER
jgi:hypothetical protein